MPMQTLSNIRGDRAIALHRRLDEAGIRTILHKSANTPVARMSLIITAAHSMQDIVVLTEALRSVVNAVDSTIAPAEEYMRNMK